MAEEVYDFVVERNLLVEVEVADEKGVVDIAIAEARATEDPLRVSELLVRRGRYLWASGAPALALEAGPAVAATAPANSPRPS